MPTIQSSGIQPLQSSNKALKARVNELESKVKTLENKSLTKDEFKSSISQSKNEPTLKTATKAGAKAGAILIGGGLAASFALEAATYSTYKFIEVPVQAALGGAMGTIGGGLAGAVSGALIGSITGSLIDNPITAAVAGGIVGGAVGLISSAAAGSSPEQTIKTAFGAVTGAAASYAVAAARQD